MPTGDGRCSLCGYWHTPGSDHIGPLRTYGHCARCGNEHSVGPCPVVAPDFPSEIHADRQLRALAKWGRAQEIGYSEPEPPIPWAEFKQDYRKQMIDRAVGEAMDHRRASWATFLEYHLECQLTWPWQECSDCGPFIRRVRARFAELAARRVVDSKTGEVMIDRVTRGRAWAWVFQHK